MSDLSRKADRLMWKQIDLQRKAQNATGHELAALQAEIAAVEKMGVEAMTAAIRQHSRKT